MCIYLLESRDLLVLLDIFCIYALAGHLDTATFDTATWGPKGPLCGPTRRRGRGQGCKLFSRLLRCNLSRRRRGIPGLAFANCFDRRHKRFHFGAYWADALPLDFELLKLINRIFLHLVLLEHSLQIG